MISNKEKVVDEKVYLGTELIEYPELQSKVVVPDLEVFPMYKKDMEEYEGLAGRLGIETK